MATDRILPWKNPTPFSGQDQAVAIALESIGRYVVESRPPFAMRASRSTALTFTGAPSATDLVANLVDYDYSNCYNSATGIYTCQLEGIYAIKGHVRLGVNSNPDEWELNCFVNGAIRSSGARMVVRGATGGDLWSFTHSDDINLVLRDQVKYVVNHIAGGNAASASLSSVTANYIAIHRVGV